MAEFTYNAKNFPKGHVVMVNGLLSRRVISVTIDEALKEHITRCHVAAKAIAILPGPDKSASANILNTPERPSPNAYQYNGVWVEGYEAQVWFMPREVA